MLKINLNLEHVEDEEKVARVIFSPSYIYKGRVSPTAFKWDVLPSGDSEDYISVLRDDGGDLTEQSKGLRPRVKGVQKSLYQIIKILRIWQLY